MQFIFRRTVQPQETIFTVSFDETFKRQSENINDFHTNTLGRFFNRWNDKIVENNGSITFLMG